MPIVTQQDRSLSVALRTLFAEKPLRDALIVFAYHYGASSRAIAKAFGVSHWTVLDKVRSVSEK